MLQVAGGAEHSALAVAHAELAGGAVVIEILLGACAEWNDAAALRGFLLGGCSCQLAAAGLGGEGGEGEDGCGYECAAAVVWSRFGLGLIFGLRSAEADELIMYGVALATGDAVEAVDAAGIIYLVMLSVDTGALAAAVAASAGIALFSLDDGTEEGEAADEPEGCAHRTYRVAPGSPPEPSTDKYDDKSHGCHNQHSRDHTLAFGKTRYGADDAAVCAIRSNECHEELDADDYRDYREGEYGIAYNLMLLDKSEMLDIGLELRDLLAFGLCLLHLLALHLVKQEASAATDPHYNVLEYAHRADDRAVYAAEHESERDDAGNDGDVECEAGG